MRTVRGMRAEGRLFVAAAIAVALVLGVAAPRAQRAFSATYDDDRQLRLEGVVTRLEWVNPRAYLFVNVRDAGGTVVNWAIELGSPGDLERSKWTRTALRVGDAVVVEGNPANGADARAFARSVLVKRTGARLSMAAAAAASRPAPGASGPVPRWPDGQVRLGAPAGQRGYWGASSAKALVEGTAGKIPMDDDGLLVNLADADRVAPFQPWAKAVYLYRQPVSYTHLTLPTKA